MLSRWFAPRLPAEPARVADPGQRRMVRVEIAIVLLVTLGMSGLQSLLSLVDSMLRSRPLSGQSVAINAPQATSSVLDLLGQLASSLRLVTWGALGVYLLVRAGLALRRVGLDRQQPGGDLLRGVALAAVIGVPGLGFYLITYALGVNLAVAPSTLTDHWWRGPVLVLSACANAWAEETLVVGYLITQLRRLGARENTSLLLSAALRGSYHLYQGFGGFLGNLVMGLVYGRTWQRTGRLWPLVIGHGLIDVVAFAGYALLRGHVSWLP